MENNNEQTGTTDTTGNKNNSSSENDKPVSLYDKTEAIVTRQEAANKKAEEILDRQERLHANQRLAGTVGGHIETKPVSPEEAKINQATEFFKGTQLEKDIREASKL